MSQDGHGGRGSGQVSFLRYTPPGPVAKRWIEALPRGPEGGAGGKILIGPVGSGKTRAALAFHIAAAIDRRFRPSPADGVRHYKLCVVRQTYRQLWDSTIPSWWKQVPKDAPGTDWVGASDAPATHTCSFVAPDGVPVLLIVEFVAFGDKSPKELLSGFEPTSFHFDEIDLIEGDVLDEAIKRAGRYPDKNTHGEPWWYGITGVANAFSIFHPLYKMMRRPPQGWVFMRQPSGLSPEAENRQNLPRGYYEAQISLLESRNRKDLIRKDVCNEQGIDRRLGRPVFEDSFFAGQHVSRYPLAVDPRRPVIVGGDGGRHPAAVFCQETDRGQWLVLGMVYRVGMGAPRFAGELKKYIPRRFPGLRLTFVGYGDPSSANPTETDERTWLQIMQQETSILWRPAPGNNDLSLRLTAIEDALAADVGYGERGLLIDGATSSDGEDLDCAMLIEGFAGGYHYPKRRGDNGDFYDPKPKKDDFSNPMDALQNALLGGGSFYTTQVRNAAVRQDQQRLAQQRRYAITDQTPGPLGTARID